MKNQPWTEYVEVKVKRSTKADSKLESPETRLAWEGLVTTLELMRVQNWDRIRKDYGNDNNYMQFAGSHYYPRFNWNHMDIGRRLG